MVNNYLLRKSLVSWMLVNANILATLIDPEEIREYEYQSEKTSYPNIRVATSITKPQDQCAWVDADITIRYNSEEKSSKQSLIGQGVIADEYDDREFLSESLRIKTRVTSLPDAKWTDSGTWEAVVNIMATVYQE